MNVILEKIEHKNNKRFFFSGCKGDIKYLLAMVKLSEAKDELIESLKKTLASSDNQIGNLKEQIKTHYELQSIKNSVIKKLEEQKEILKHMINKSPVVEIEQFDNAFRTTYPDGTLVRGEGICANIKPGETKTFRLVEVNGEV